MLTPPLVFAARHWLMVIGKPTTRQLYVWLCAGLQINIATNINITTYVNRRVPASNKDKKNRMDVTYWYQLLTTKQTYYATILPLYKKWRHWSFVKTLKMTYIYVFLTNTHNNCSLSEVRESGGFINLEWLLQLENINMGGILRAHFFFFTIFRLQLFKLDK